MMPWDFIRRVKNLHKLMTLNHVELMQFTGFKDCEGNEIFDGDILLDTQHDFETGQQVYWDKKLGCWKLDNTFFQTKQSGYLLANDLQSFKFKIIGNIYENPKLIEPDVAV